MANFADRGPEESLNADERALLCEIVRALRTIRYGSVVLTMHDGRLVEIHKTERIRTTPTARKK
jgi:hypothetical protein